MPPPRKIDLMPEALRAWLRDELAARGFAQIEDVTEALNFRLEEAGQELRIGKTSVGEFSKALKDQREAFAIAETLLSDMDVEAEGELHKVLMQMIATSAVHMINSVREGEGHLDPKDLMMLGRMLKDLMASSGMREKLLEDERARIRREAEAAVRKQVSDNLERATAEAGLSERQAASLRRDVLGVRT